MPRLRTGQIERVGDRGLLEGALRAVGEAGDHPGVLAPLLREPLLRRRIAVRVLQALDVAHQQRGDPEALDVAEEVALHSGLVAVARGVHHSGRVRLGLEDRADGAVELGVHHHDVLAALDRPQHDGGAVLDRTRHLENAVDALRVAEDERVVGVGRHAAAHRLAEGGHAVDGHRTLHAGVLVDAASSVRMPIRDGDELHPAGRVEDLVGHALGHEPRADHGEADRLARRLALAERLVDHDHRAAFVPATWNWGHEASFSEMISISRGHSIPNAGSS